MVWLLSGRQRQRQHLLLRRGSKQPSPTPSSTLGPPQLVLPSGTCRAVNTSLLCSGGLLTLRYHTQSLYPTWLRSTTAGKLLVRLRWQAPVLCSSSPAVSEAGLLPHAGATQYGTTLFRNICSLLAQLYGYMNRCVMHDWGRASTGLGPGTTWLPVQCRGQTSIGLISTGNHWWLVKRDCSTLEARTCHSGASGMLHASAFVQTARTVLLPLACFTAVQVSAAIDTGSSPGPQAAVMYALQLALITDGCCEPQAPGKQPGPDHYATPSEELEIQSSSHDGATYDYVATCEPQTGHPMPSRYALP